MAFDRSSASHDDERMLGEAADTELNVSKFQADGLSTRTSLNSVECQDPESFSIISVETQALLMRRVRYEVG